MSPLQDQIDGLVRAIVECVHPRRIILFGSAVRGQATVDSDIDVLVVMPDGAHRRQTAQRLYRGIRGVSVPYDLLVATKGDLIQYRDNPGLIYRSILLEGRTLYAA